MIVAIVYIMLNILVSNVIVSYILHHRNASSYQTSI